MDTCAAWHCKGVNEYGDTEYAPALTSPPVLFLARIEHTRKEVLDKDGNRVISEAYLLTDMELSPLDIVDTGGRQWTVKSVAPINDITGQLDHYEVTL